MFLEFLKLFAKIFGFISGFALCVWLIVIAGQWNCIAGVFMFIFTLSIYIAILLTLDL